MKTYWEKLTDPRWQKLRLHVLDRDQWTCQVCGSKEETLHVHHGHYKSKADPWEYDPDTLHTVCERCHWDADDLRVDLQYEVAKLPLECQRWLFKFVSWLNSKWERSSITWILSTTAKSWTGDRDGKN